MMPVLINDVPVNCINQAAIANHVPATLILSIMKKENGRNGQAVPNKNGSYDLGVMQVNTCWLSVLARHGYTHGDLQFNPCKNVMAATWILAMGLANGKTLWSGVGNYNSHTARFNKRYRNSVSQDFDKISHAIML